MMKVKKFFALLLCLIMSLCIGLVAACDVTVDDGNGGTTDGNGGTTDGNGGTTDGNGGTTDDNGGTTDGNGGTTDDNGGTTDDNGGNDEVKHEKLADKKIYVVGDSTVCDYAPKLDYYYLPRYGYGTQLFNYIDLTNASQVVNLALSGRSSLSFLTESNYTTLKNSIKEGDYLIIGFGHNDEKSAEAARFTDPHPDYQTATTSGGKPSFQYTLYQNYVKLAKDKGAIPILCTPIVRYNASGSYTGSVAHVTADGDYPAAIKKLGADTNTAVVDLTKLTADYYTAHNDDAKYFHAFTTYTESGSDKIPDGIDTTHINMYGAKMISYWFASNLPKDCPLKANVKESIAAPTYAADFPAAVRSDYVKPVYNGFNPAEHTANKVDTIGGVDWYHTAMGILGGATKVSEYSFNKDNGKYTIATGSGSKFAAAQDGFGAIFTQIDITKNFTISVKAKVTANPQGANDQVAFGVMLRDDIYIDTHDTTITSNFVSASLTTKGNANMSRTSKTALEYDKTLAFAQDAEYEITLIRVGQTITATIKQGANSVNTTFTDTSFVGIDNNYFYLCLFANRQLTVEFSDVAFEITGDAQGA